MRTKLSVILGAAICLAAGSMFGGSPSPGRVTFLVVTAANSPSNSFSLQNVSDWVRGGYSGLKIEGQALDADYPHSPNALQPVPVWRFCQTISTTNSSVYMHDSTNTTPGDPGNFGFQKGDRIDIVPDTGVRSNRFQAKDWFYHIYSTEPAASISFTGNMATNAANGSPLLYTSTFVGQEYTNKVYFNTNGVPIWTNLVLAVDNHSSEFAPTLDVSRMWNQIRVTWPVNDAGQLALALNYGKNNQDCELVAGFWNPSTGEGFTNRISTRVLVAQLRGGQPVASVYVYEQRQIGNSYTLYTTPQLNPQDWSVVVTNHPGGIVLHTNALASSLYKASKQFHPPASALLNLKYQALLPKPELVNDRD